jgi:hypothetical protein
MKFTRDREFDAVDDLDDGLLEADGFHVGRPDRTRGFWLTLLLCLLIVGYSFAVWSNVMLMAVPYYMDFFKRENPGKPGWFLPAVTVCVASNVFWLIGLLRWKKWGFYGFSLTCGCMFALHIAAASNESSGWWSMDYLNAVLSPAVAVILFLLLRWGGARSAWSLLT